MKALRVLAWIFVPYIMILVDWKKLNRNSKEEKQRRNTIAKRKKRRDEGVAIRDEYLKNQHDITNQHLNTLKKLIKENPKITNKELGELLSVSPARIGQFKKIIKS